MLGLTKCRQVDWRNRGVCKWPTFSVGMMLVRSSSCRRYGRRVTGWGKRFLLIALKPFCSSGRSDSLVVRSGYKQSGDLFDEAMRKASDWWICKCCVSMYCVSMCCVWCVCVRWCSPAGFCWVSVYVWFVCVALRKYFSLCWSVPVCRLSSVSWRVLSCIALREAFPIVSGLCVFRRCCVAWIVPALSIACLKKTKKTNITSQNPMN